MVVTSSSSNEIQYPNDVKSGFEELCPVCGDKVSGYHYGLLTCESCKGFFKRTVQNKKVYSCVDNRSCHIDKSQRKRCPYCRFQKCLNVGMKLEAVRQDRMRGGRNKFGPMYKRDRALKQQAVRQQQHILTSCQMRLSNGMGPLSTESQDIKPDPATLMSTAASMGYVGVSSPMLSNNPSPVMQDSPLVHLHHSSQPESPITPTSQGSYSGDHGYPLMVSTIHNSYQSALHAVPHPAPMPLVPQLISDLKASLADENEIKHKLLTFIQSEFAKEDFTNYSQKLLQMICRLADQLLFLMVEWARSSIFFKELKVEDQMKLLQNCWSEVLILDLAHRLARQHWSGELVFSSGHKLGMESLETMGLGDMKDGILELVKKIRDLKIDVNEYVCLKFLILLNPGKYVAELEDRQYVESCQEKVNAALMEYCINFYPSVKDKFGQVLLRLPEIRVISIRAEEYLYFKHMNGEMPEQTLLMEMLHSKKK
ncbi:hypothetical protein ACJMK2_040207 [Sinanodonta woodiana]|uniref:Nuclear receptor subfamily 5 group A member 2 n=1 Tax=Sinanodonta woodiana TaxID=1069815 RepID=A0ABD3WHN8_SINWO